MYVAGGLYLRDRKRGRVFNACLLFDRDGQLVGRYDKNHLYTPELWSPASPSPGRAIPVFKTDFGTVGILICYDSWFPDVAELLALKGAEIILFPNAGYFRGLMPARAADNCVRFVVSSLHNSPGIWDSAGRDVTNPEADPTNCAGVPPQATARFVGTKQVRKARMVFATLDLSRPRVRTTGAARASQRRGGDATGASKCVSFMTRSNGKLNDGGMTTVSNADKVLWSGVIGFRETACAPG